jgi:hypothetical protein
METLLGIWIQDHVDRNMPVSFLMTEHTALPLFEDIKKEYGESSTPLSVTASYDWFERFKRRCNLHNIKMTGEAASADKGAAKYFPQILKDIIKGGGYSPKQIYNDDETGLHWKRMSSRTYNSKEEKTAPGFKAAKDRLTLNAWWQH